MSRRANPTRRPGKTQNLCGCGTPTKDAAFVCDRCIDTMAADLRELLPTTDDPGLWVTLESVIAGERGIDYRTLGGGSGGSVATGIVLDENAVQRARKLRQVLTRLVMDCVARGVSHTGPPTAAAAPDPDVP